MVTTDVCLADGEDHAWQLYHTDVTPARQMGQTIRTDTYTCPKCSWWRTTITSPDGRDTTDTQPEETP
jgi:hypothetical protein